MNLPDLQNWMVEEGLRTELDDLTRRTVRAELDNLAIASADDQVGSTPDWPRLLFAGSILARSSERSQQEAALRIATAAMTLSSRDAVRDTAAVLLSKLCEVFGTLHREILL
jgi:hypothetical protein